MTPVWLSPVLIALNILLMAVQSGISMPGPGSVSSTETKTFLPFCVIAMAPGEMLSAKPARRAPSPPQALSAGDPGDPEPRSGRATTAELTATRCGQAACMHTDLHVESFRRQQQGGVIESRRSRMPTYKVRVNGTASSSLRAAPPARPQRPTRSHATSAKETATNGKSSSTGTVSPSSK